MPRIIKAKYPGKCGDCGQEFPAGTEILWSRDEGAVHVHCRHEDPEYLRGQNDVRQAQLAGPAGSAAREAAYLAMEAQWAREGFDG